jgi:Na+:H+ antiporter, NhaA family
MVPSIVVGVVVGLTLGKPLGIFAAVWLARAMRLASFPVGITWRHLGVLGVVAGVGFTMAIFIAQLAFADPSNLRSAKLAVLGASALAGVIALLVGAIALPPAPVAGVATTADEAESSTEK